jgi:hypothetical protein
MVYLPKDEIAIAALCKLHPVCSLRHSTQDKTDLRRVALPDFHISPSTVLSNQRFSAWRASAGDFLPAEPAYSSPVSSTEMAPGFYSRIVMGLVGGYRCHIIVL